MIPKKRPPQKCDFDFSPKPLPWDRAITAGVVTEAQADMLCDCVGTDGEGAWHITTTGLDVTHCEALERAVRFFCSGGGQ